MEVYDEAIGKISICTGFMDSMQMKDEGILPKNRNERRNVMKENSSNKYQNKKGTNNYSNNVDNAKNNQSMDKLNKKSDSNKKADNNKNF